MRIFTTDEQRLLERIRTGEGRNLYSLIDPWINGVSFHVNIETNDVDFIFEATPGLNFQDRLQEIQTIVIQSVNLIKLFEDKGYILTFINLNQLPPNPFSFGQASINVPSIPYHFPDPRISKMFCEYSVREIFVTPELSKFISDGFITREEVRANRQWFTTRNALGVAIVALLLNVLFNILNIRNRNSNETTKPKSNTEQISNTTKLDIKSDTIILKDTVMVVKTTTIVTRTESDTIR